MRTGIFGGSFDPVHNDHIRICARFIKELKLEKVYVIPAALSPFKTETDAGGTDRFNMLSLAFKDIPEAVADRREIDRKGTSYTFETIRDIKEKNPHNELYFLIGADCLGSFNKWKNPEYILENAQIVVAGRSGYDLDKAAYVFRENNGRSPIVIEADGGISSSFVRELLKLGVYDENYLNKDVIDYIKSHSLYKGGGYYDYVQKVLKKPRLYHTAGVIAACEKYARSLGADINEAKLAGLLHDVAKYMKVSDFKDCGKDVPCDAPESVVHQYLGAYVAEHVLGIENRDILNAVRYHTTGRPDMSLLEKIVFVSDLVEEGRDYGEAVMLRRAVDENFEQGFLFCLKRLLFHLVNSGKPVYEPTLKTAEYYNVKISD